MWREFKSDEKSRIKNTFNILYMQNKFIPRISDTKADFQMRVKILKLVAKNEEFDQTIQRKFQKCK